MSNPLAPPSQPTQRTLQFREVIGDAVVAPSDEQKRLTRDLNNLDKAQALLKPLGFANHPPFVIQKARTMDRRILRAAEPKRAMAANTGFNVKARSAYACELVLGFTLRVRQAEAAGLSGEFACAAKIKEEGMSVVMASGNPEHCYGRLIKNLRVGSAAERGVLRPLTEAAALRAMDSCGQAFPTPDYLAGRRVAQPLVESVEEGVPVCSMNPVANTGFPLLVSHDYVDPETGESALARLSLLMGAIHAELKELDMRCVGSMDEWLTRVGAWLNVQLDQRPYLYAVQGKCKTDFYSAKKVENNEMRFYNVLPGQVVGLMKPATQAYQQACLNVFDDPSLTSFQGCSFAHGGAERVVDALQHQLEHRGFGFVTNGDDSWIAARWKRGVMMFALDCTSFDLTQCPEVTRALRYQMYVRLYHADRIAAALWYWYTEKRLTVLAHTLVYMITKGGPSGIPLQSKVNDGFMTAFIFELFEEFEKAATRNAAPYRLIPETEDELNEVIQQVGAGLGLKVKLESFSLGEGAMSVREAVRRTPFKFCGYHVHVARLVDHEETERECAVVAFDLPRMMSRIRTSGVKWLQDKEFFVAERLRVAAMVLQMGVPPMELAGAFDFCTRYALAGLAELPDQGLQLAPGVLAQAVQADVHGGVAHDLPNTVAGLRRAFDADRLLRMWLAPQQRPEPAWVPADGAVRLRFELPRRGPPLSRDLVIYDPVTGRQAGRMAGTQAARLQAQKEEERERRAAVGVDPTSGRTRRGDQPSRRRRQAHEAWQPDDE